MQSNRIDISIDIGSDDQTGLSELQRLRQSLDSIRQSQDALRKSTFDAFSRSAIQPQLQQLDELSTRVRKSITELQVLGQTVAPNRGVQALVDSLIGVDRQILSASASARVLATSLSAAAEADDRVRRTAEETAQMRLGLNRRLVQDAAEMVAREKAYAAAISQSNAAQLERIRNANLAAATTRPQTLTTQQIIERTTGVGQAPAFMPEQIAEMQSSWVRYGRSARTALQEAYEGIRQNRVGALELQAAMVNTVQALASGMNPLHVAVMESAQVWGALVQGGILPFRTMVTAITSPIGLAVTGITAMAAAMTALAYSTRNANDELSKAASTAALQGRPARLVEDNARAMAAEIARSGGLGRVESRTGAIAIQNIPGISAQARSDLAASFEAFMRTLRLDAEETAKFIGEAFSSPAAIKGFVDQNQLLGEMSQEHRELFEAAVAAGDGLTASSIAAEAARARLQNWIGALQRARDGLGDLGRNLDITGQAFENLLRQQSDRTLLETPIFEPGTFRPTEIESRGIEAAERMLRTERDINALLLQRRQLRAAIPAATDEGRREAFVRAQQTTELNLARTHTALQQEAHNVQMAQLQAELQMAERAAEHDISQRRRVLGIRQQIADAIAAYEQGALERTGDAVRRLSAEEIQERQKVADERRRIAREALESRMFQSELRAANEPTNPIVQLREAQQRLNDLAKDTTSSETERRSLTLQIAGLYKSVADYNRDSAVAVIQQSEAIAQSRQDLAAIVDLRRQEQGTLTRYATPAERIRAETAVIQAQIQAQQRSIQLTQQAADITNTFAADRLSTQRALLDFEVTQYSQSRESAIQAEMAFTIRVNEEQRNRTRELLNQQGLLPEQRAQINSQLANLYEQDAQKQLELQTRLTEEIRRENERRIQYFRNFFQTVEGGLANLLIAGLNRTQTRSEAFKSLAQNLVSSFVREMANMGSQWAGRGLADAFGIKIDPRGDTSISSVLARGVGSWLGLTKDEPTVDQAAIAQLMQSAAEAHQSAASMLKEAATALTNAANSAPFGGGGGSRALMGSVAPSVRGTTGLAPEFKSSLERMIADASEEGITLGIGSGLRSTERQAQLWAEALAKYGSEAIARKHVAPPGRSMHEYGFAADLTDASGRAIRPGSPESEWLARRAGDFGITRPMSWEPWHVEPSGRRGGSKVATVEIDSAHIDRFDVDTPSGSWSPREEGGSPQAIQVGSQFRQNSAMFTQGLGIAASALSLFGGELSSTGRIVVGVFGLLAQITTLLQTANIANTTATITNTVATHANSAAQSAASGGSILGGFLKMIPIIGGFFEHGGIVPSAQHGMIVGGRGGQLGIVHPREMVLPAHLSDGIQNLINQGVASRAPMGGGSSSVTNSPVLNYSPSITGYHPYRSRSDFEGLLRSHGDVLSGYVKELIRNNWRP